MHREGRELVPTAKAFQLMTLLRGLGVEDLTKPELTGNWEYQLAEMEKGRPARGLHGRDRGDGRAHRQEGQGVRPRHHPGDYATLKAPCPNCGGVVKENYRRLHLHRQSGDAEGCGFLDRQDPRRAQLRTDERWRLHRDKKIGPLEGFRPRRAGPSPPSSSWPTTTRSPTGSWSSISARTRARPRRRRAGRFLRPGIARRLPQVPGQGVRARQQLRACEHAVGAHVTCDFKSGKIILQQPVAREQMSKLLPAARPSCWRTSSPTRRAQVQGLPAYDKKEGKVVFEFGRARQGHDQGAGQEGAAKKSARSELPIARRATAGACGWP